MMGNTIVWKAADTQVYSAQILMEIFMKAGMPAGVINLIYADGPETGEVIFNHPDFAGVHFTGSTGVFRTIWKEIGNNIHKYKSYPRIVWRNWGGKTLFWCISPLLWMKLLRLLHEVHLNSKGKNALLHQEVYVPSNLMAEFVTKLSAELKTMKMGPTEDFSNFINAVIDKRAFDKITQYIDQAKADSDADIVCGGNYDDSKGWFIEPTVIVAKDGKYTTMCEEIFGPVLTVYEYPEDEFEATVKLVDRNITLRLNWQYHFT